MAPKEASRHTSRAGRRCKAADTVVRTTVGSSAAFRFASRDIVSTRSATISLTGETRS